MKEHERGALWALAVDEGFLILPECPSLQHSFVLFKKIQRIDTSRHISSLLYMAHKVSWVCSWSVLLGTVG